MALEHDIQQEFARVWGAIDGLRRDHGESKLILVEIKSQLDHIAGIMKNFSSDTGLARCAVRGQVLSDIQGRITDLEKGGVKCEDCIHEGRLSALEHQAKFGKWLAGIVGGAAVLGLAKAILALVGLAA